MPIRPDRIFHVNVNCSDLARSLAFYRDLLGLEPSTHTAPDTPQPGAAFGLASVQWDAWMLRPRTPGSTPVLDLLEWLVPGPGAEPPRGATTRGFARLGVAVPDLRAQHDRLRDAGADVWSDPVEVELPGGATAATFVCGDPDGTQLEFVEGPAHRLAHVTVNCADLDRSTRYYEDVAGLVVLVRAAAVTRPARLLRLERDATGRVSLLQDPGSGFAIELVEWIDPPPVTAAARAANDLGIFRMAWVTDDLDADYDALDDAGVACFAPPATLAMGPGLPDVRALFWNDPDGACLELIEATGPGAPDRRGTGG